MSDELMRDKFEEVAYQKYFFSIINPDLTIKNKLMYKSEFCAKDENGEYVIRSLDAAWWGFKEGFVLSQTKI